MPTPKQKTTTSEKAAAEKKALEEKVLAALSENFRRQFAKGGISITPNEPKPTGTANKEAPAQFSTGKKHDGDTFSVSIEVGTEEPKTNFVAEFDKSGNFVSASLPDTNPPFDSKSNEQWSPETIKAHADVMKAVPKGAQLQGLPKTTLANAAGFVAAGKQAGLDGKEVKNALSNIQEITDTKGNKYSITDKGQLQDDKGNTYDVDKNSGQLTDQKGTTYELDGKEGLTATAGAASGSSRGVTLEADTEAAERRNETPEEKDARLRETTDRGIEQAGRLGAGPSASPPTPKAPTSIKLDK
ncbi:MAG: hypothetical protein P1U34_10010 [Coxiellaceae bacterium]|nr:hypothetical protein [Coxiellaceae bacterium]